ncbi:MAG: cytochrome c oxidase subunit 3 [Methylovirgula sp.]
MLTALLARIFRGHFDASHHFAFEAVSWYWHFVDVVWLLLFVCFIGCKPTYSASLSDVARRMASRRSDQRR